MPKIIFHETPLEEIQAFIYEAVASQFKKYQLSNPEEPEKLFNRPEAAKYLKISLPTLHEYTKNGTIQAVRIGSRVRYRKTDIEAALKTIRVAKNKNGF